MISYCGSPFVSKPDLATNCADSIVVLHLNSRALLSLKDLLEQTRVDVVYEATDGDDSVGARRWDPRVILDDGQSTANIPLQALSAGIAAGCVEGLERAAEGMEVLRRGRAVAARSEVAARGLLEDTD